MLNTCKRKTECKIVYLTTLSGSFTSEKHPRQTSLLDTCPQRCGASVLVNAFKNSGWAQLEATVRMCDSASSIIRLEWGRAWHDAILFISGRMDVQLTVIRRGKQQLFTGVKVVPLGKVITLLTLRKNRGCGTGQDTADSRVWKGKRKLFLQSN